MGSAPTPDGRAGEADDGAPAAVRLVCLDVDGTLVGTSGEVDPAVWAAAARAREAGILLAVCSGRPGFGVTRDLAARVAPDGWHCFQNGASVLHLGSGESRSATLAPHTVAMLVERARRTGRSLELYSDDDYVTESRTALVQRHAELLGLDFLTRPFDTLGAPVVRAQWLFEEAEADAVLAEPHPGLEVSPALAPTMPGAVFVNLTRAGVHKGTAVRIIAEAYGVSLGDVMYVGDGYNDTPALGIVGWPVAMANAEPAARALARQVVGHVDAAGVVDALELALASGPASGPAARRPAAGGGTA